MSVQLCDKGDKIYVKKGENKHITKVYELKMKGYVRKIEMILVFILINIFTRIARN